MLKVLLKLAEKLFGDFQEKGQQNSINLAKFISGHFWLFEVFFFVFFCSPKLFTYTEKFRSFGWRSNFGWNWKYPEGTTKAILKRPNFAKTTKNSSPFPWRINPSKWCRTYNWSSLVDLRDKFLFSEIKKLKSQFLIQFNSTGLYCGEHNWTTLFDVSTLTFQRCVT